MKTSTKSTRPKSTDVRLLRAVIAIGAILFALKAAGLAFTASAATPAPAAPPAAATPAKPAATAPAVKPGAPADPLAAINAALPRPAKPAPASADAARAADELSSDVVASVSSAEMDVLTSLADRRDALEQRKRELDLRANIIAATEKRVDDKIAQLKAMQSRIEAMLGQRDAKEAEQLDGLVKVYTAMKPKDAARIFAALDDTVRIGVASRMKADIMAGILAALPSDVAQKLTVELANRFKAPPDATVPAAPLPAAAAAAPGNTPATPPASPTAAAPSNPASSNAAASAAPAPAPQRPQAPKG